MLDMLFACPADVAVAVKPIEAIEVLEMAIERAIIEITVLLTLAVSSVGLVVVAAAVGQFVVAAMIA
jgi:hypothetical protein